MKCLASHPTNLAEVPQLLSAENFINAVRHGRHRGMDETMGKFIQVSFNPFQDKDK